jgi:hypothetical protein
MEATFFPAPPVVPLVVPPISPALPQVQSAATLARAYDAAMAACWRGEGEGCRFLSWLAGYRSAGGGIPSGTPVAVSIHGASGRGIAWFDAPPLILGCVAGEPWGYRVPSEAVPPPAAARPH